MNPLSDGKRFIVGLGDNREVLKRLSDSYCHACITDPPYGLSFMGKKWDYDVPTVETWEQVFRVLVPGAHLLCFGGTRTYHRLVCAIEDAGFEIRDQIGWLYGNGFPKGANLKGDFEGWNTSLKPAWEPICVARKPFVGTVTKNVEAFGTGAYHVDACRVGIGGGCRTSTPYAGGNSENCYGKGLNDQRSPQVEGLGRWPANVVHDGSEEIEESFAAFGQSKSVSRVGKRSGKVAGRLGDFAGQDEAVMGHSDEGTPSRYFYCAKVSAKERGVGNDHPTVKPVSLMRWLCRLVTPDDGIVLDPFCGSGSTGMAAKVEGLRFVGVEMDPRYRDIAKKRIAEYQNEEDKNEQG